MGLFDAGNDDSDRLHATILQIQQDIDEIVTEIRKHKDRLSSDYHNNLKQDEYIRKLQDDIIELKASVKILAKASVKITNFSSDVQGDANVEQ